MLPPLADAAPHGGTLLDPAQEPGDAVAQAPLVATLRKMRAVFEGDWLAQAGPPLPAMEAERVALFRLEAA